MNIANELVILLSDSVITSWETNSAKGLLILKKMLTRVLL